MVETLQQPEKQPERAKLSTENLSDLGKYAYQGFIDATKAAADPFFEDLNSTDPAMGIMSKAKAIGKERIQMVQAGTAQHFHRLVDQIALNYKKRLFALDEVYKQRLAAVKGDDAAKQRVELDAEFQRQFKELEEECGARVDQLRESLTGLARQIGGENEFLDTNEEINRWAKHVLPLLKGLKVDEVKLGKAGMDVEFAKDQYAQAFAILEQLRSGNPLNRGDYEKIFAMIIPFMDRRFDRKSQNATRATLEMLERSGALLIVEAMNPEQRFNLAEAWIKHPDRNPMQKRQGLLFLAGANYLNLRQTDDLLRHLDPQTPDQYALREAEWKELEETQAMIVKVKKEAAQMIDKNPDRSLVGEHFTASNMMFYEVIGRVALVGTAISTGLAVQRAVTTGDPTQLTQTLMSPIYLTGVTIMGVTYEHVTGKGNLGEGDLSQKLAELQTKGRETETPDARVERNKKERLSAAMGNNVETLAFLRANKGKVLEQILKIVEAEEAPSDYHFSFNDLPKPAQGEYHGLDYRTRSATETQITNLFQLLYTDSGLQTTSEMLARLNQIDREMGLTATV